MVKTKKEAGWETYVKSLGFKWNNEKGQYVKAGNFGSSVTVEALVKRLFHITKNKEVVHSDFVWTFDEFKQILNDALN